MPGEFSCTKLHILVATSDTVAGGLTDRPLPLPDILSQRVSI
jgi:hypothetical protein